MRYPIIVLAATGLAALVHAQIVADSDRLGYTGTVTRYVSLADAQAGTNALGTFSLDGVSRDLGLFYTRNAAAYYEDFAQVGTAWTFTTTGPGLGVGNPSNVNRGFVQIPAVPGTAPAITAAWDASRTSFNFAAHGTGVFLPSYSRLWNGTDESFQLGTFLDYRLSLVASGLEQATWVDALGAYASFSDPTAVTGRLSGIFLNSSIGTQANGYYAFDFTLNLDSWLYANRDNLATLPNPEAPYNLYQPSYFAAANAVPEPSTYGLLGAGALLALALWRRSRHSRG